MSKSTQEDPIVIVRGARTPMGGFQGELSDATAPQLGTASIQAVLERADLTGDDVDEVIMGCVLPDVRLWHESRHARP